MVYTDDRNDHVESDEAGLWREFLRGNAGDGLHRTILLTRIQSH